LPASIPNADTKFVHFVSFCYYGGMQTPFVTFRRLGRKGRLGNQLFQIAAAMGIARRHGYHCIFPPWPPAAWFKTELQQRMISPRLYRRFHVRKHTEQSREPYAITLHGNTDLDGYFQSYTWFEDCQDLIRQQFQPRQAIVDSLQRTHAAALATSPCAVHIRRGDYVGAPHRFNIWKSDYYDRAFGLVDATTFMLFSDDMPWVKKRFQGDQFIYVTDQPPCADLFLMSLCACHIIPNSTFSWWGAWLANSSQVVYPLPWMANRRKPVGLFPPHWTALTIPGRSLKKKAR